VKPAIIFDDYETISDLLLNLGQGFSLRMCVNLGDKNKENEKQPISNEYLYRTNKYVNKDKVVSVKRKFFPYIAIEYKDESELFGKGMAKITHYDILGFRSKVLLVDTKLEGTFAIKNKKIFIPSEHNFSIQSMLSDHLITFRPTIVSYQDATASPGVRLEMNDKLYVDIQIKTWKAFVYYIVTADLYGWAASIVSGYTSVGDGLSDMRSISKDPTIGETIPDGIGFGKTKPLTQEEKRRSFFDN
jgi:hypothetical protein